MKIYPEEIALRLVSYAMLIFGMSIYITVMHCKTMFWERKEKIYKSTQSRFGQALPFSLV